MEKDSVESFFKRAISSRAELLLALSAIFFTLIFSASIVKILIGLQFGVFTIETRYLNTMFLVFIAGFSFKSIYSLLRNMMLYLISKTRS